MTKLKMDFKGITLSELYNLVSSRRIQETYKTGVLLYICTPGLQCNTCRRKQVACIRAAGVSSVHDTDDGILAEWVEENAPLSDTISQVVRCAFRLLDKLNLHKGKHSLLKPIQIVISAGMFSKVNGNERWGCVITGPAVDQIKSVQRLHEYGTIILSPETWQLCDSTEYTVVYNENRRAVKVLSINQPKTMTVEDINHNNIDICVNNDSRRAYLLTTAERDSIISKYMTQEALKQIHDNQPSQDLPEILPITIIFINLQCAHSLVDVNDSRNKVFEIIREQIHNCRGEICNIVSSDEGCIFLCAVGLPGDERQDKTTQALETALRIHTMCREVEGLLCVSVGVTTGRAVYEIQQLPFRTVFRVYGENVDLAAKLTTEYPGIVSFDTATKLYSTLHLPLSKGISKHEKVYYQEEIDEMFADEAARSPSAIDSRRLALAHMQTLLEDEQGIVKCASAIGETFSLEMLKAILPYMSEEDLTEYLQTLFRVGIFKCASEPQNILLARTCNCYEPEPTLYPGHFPEPKWTCRLMRFCSNDEREMAYKLLRKSPNSHKAIHKECAKYLEKKTHRCIKCKLTKFIFQHKSATYDKQHLQSILQSQGIYCHNDIYNCEEKNYDAGIFLAKVKTVVGNEHDRMVAAGRCECAEIVDAVLLPGLRHWKSAGDVPRTFSYLIESAAACTYLHKDLRALEYLTEARSILKNVQEGLPAFPSADPGDVQICEIQTAFMYRLTGEILFKTGKIAEAEENFRSALTLLNCSFPSNYAALLLKSISEKQKKLFGRIRRFEIPEKRELERLQECVDCLSFMWRIACMRGQSTAAYVAITMQINRAGKSGDPFKILYTAIDYLKYNQFKGEECECWIVETILCKICPGLSDHPEGQKLITHLIQTLAVVKLCTGNLEKAVVYNKLAEQLSEPLNRPGLDVSAIAALHLPLLLKDRPTEEILQLTQTLENLSKERPDSRTKGWFYASCLNLLLHSETACRPFEECLAFTYAIEQDETVQADKSLMLHLYSAVALWFARLSKWDLFNDFYRKACKVYCKGPACIESLSGAVILLECTMLVFKKSQTQQHTQRRRVFRHTEEFFYSITMNFGEDHIFQRNVMEMESIFMRLAGDSYFTYRNTWYPVMY